MAAHLVRTGVQVLEIRHSRRLRAAQTATVIADAIGPRTPPREVSGLDPMDDVEDVACDLAVEELPLMLVGHMPFMGRPIPPARGPSTACRSRKRQSQSR